MDDNEILISTDDAALLRTLVDQDALGAGEAADALADSLDVARIIQAAQLPRDIVSLGAAVRYAELPAGRERDVVLVHPSDAAPSDGRISVLSPVGRSL
ncbi:MAG TPA: GreA/GreB family elongation factor, partial [Burkholderiaceae bacterium]|nr:GreA/GreB family elongation factor [Burkholderiaceae bacterium]